MRRFRVKVTARSAARPTDDLTAYDLYLRAYAMALSSTRQIPEALRLLEQAIERDPRYGPALVWAALCCFRLFGDGRSEDPEADRLKGVDFARRALEVAGDDPGILADGAHVLAYFGEDIGAMMALVDRALALNPNSRAAGTSAANSEPGRASPTSRSSTSMLRCASVPACKPAGQRRPLTPRISWPGALMRQCRSCSSQYKRILATRRRIVIWPPATRIWVGSTAAREIITQLRAITPDVIHDPRYLRNTEHRELFLSGLRLAAGEPS